MQEKVRSIVESRTFNIFIMVTIVINALILGIQTTDLPDNIDDIFEFFDNICLLIYIIEAILKLVAYRTKYFHDGWNIFDLAIILLALIPEWVLPVPSEIARMLRVFRAIKAFRLVSAFRSMRVVVDAIVKSIPGVVSTAVLMFIVAYIYAIIGTVAFDEVSPEDFGDLSKTLFTLFQVMTLEGWPDVCRPIMEEYPLTSIYFVTYIIISAFVMINVVVGIVISTIEESQAALQKEIEEAKREEDPKDYPITNELQEVKNHLLEVERLVEKLETTDKSKSQNNPS